MDIIDVMEKTVSESLRYDFDFTDHPAISQRGASLAAILSLTITPTTTPALTHSTPLVSGKIAQVQLSQGVDKTIYLLTCKAITDQGDEIETHGRLYVTNPT